MFGLEELWRRVTLTTPVPDAFVLLVIAGVSLALVVFAWPVVRMAVTVCHEAGHAVVATLTGRKLQGIRLHSDTSGVTITKGRPGGAGVALVLFAGYPAASLVGLLAAYVAGAGYAIGLLWLLVALLALMLLQIRNLVGAGVVLALGAALGLASWYAPIQWLVWLAFGVAWLLLLAGPRPVLELALNRRASGSDAAQLARLTHVPGPIWIALWLVATVGALVWGAMLMLPGLLPAPH